MIGPDVRFDATLGRFGAAGCCAGPPPVGAALLGLVTFARDAGLPATRDGEPLVPALELD